MKSPSERSHDAESSGSFQEQIVSIPFEPTIIRQKVLEEQIAGLAESDEQLLGEMAERLKQREVK